MGIKIKNLDHILVDLSVAGTLTATANKRLFECPINGYIVAIQAELNTPGTGVTSTIVDIHLNGTTIFAAAAKMTFAATTGVTSMSTFTTDPPAVSKGDYITVDVDQISTGPANLSLNLLLSRRTHAVLWDVNFDNVY